MKTRVKGSELLNICEQKPKEKEKKKKEKKKKKKYQKRESKKFRHRFIKLNTKMVA